MAKEVVETEKTYVKHLETLCKVKSMHYRITITIILISHIQVFIAPLKEASETDHPILSSNDIKDIYLTISL